MHMDIFMLFFSYFYRSFRWSVWDKIAWVKGHLLVCCQMGSVRLPHQLNHPSLGLLGVQLLTGEREDTVKLINDLAGLSEKKWRHWLMLGSRASKPPCSAAEWR